MANTDHKGRIGRRKLHKVLKVLENSYERSVTYQSLIGELCSFRQKRGETPKAYYERLTTIVLLIRERHGDRIKVKELDSTAKDCFYSGLHEQYQPLVVHLKDKAYTTASDLLGFMKKPNPTCGIVAITIAPSTITPTSLRWISL